MKIPTRTYVDSRLHSITEQEPVAPGTTIDLRIPAAREHGEAVSSKAVCVDYAKFPEPDASGALAEAWFETLTSA